MENDEKFVIFILEDNDLYSTMMKYILSRDSSNLITIFSNSKDFLLESKIPNLIVIDHQLNDGSDGLITLKEFRKLHKETPAILVSSLKERKLIMDYVDTGIIDYIHKDTLCFHVLNQKVKEIKEHKIHPIRNLLNNFFNYFK